MPAGTKHPKTVPVAKQYPRGTCYCGCRAKTTDRSLFVRGHDRIALQKVEALYGGIAEMVVAHGQDK